MNGFIIAVVLVAIIAFWQLREAVIADHNRSILVWLCVFLGSVSSLATIEVVTT